MNTLRYGLIGTGMMGHEHLKNIALLRDTEDVDLAVTALVDPNQSMADSARGLARDLGNQDVRVYSRLEDMPEDSVDVLVLASPNYTHHDIILKLLPLQKPMLVEKPLCTTLSQCDELWRRLQHFKAPFWVAMEYRYMPPTSRFIQRLRNGDVGQIRLLSIREHRFPFLEKVGNWNRFSRNTGGTLVEKCCHHFDLMRLMIQAEPVRVYASGAIDVNHLDEQYNGETPDIIDNALVIVDFDNGARASLELCMFADGAEPQEQLSAIGEVGKLDAYIPGPDRFWPNAVERHPRVVLQARDKSEPQVDIIKIDQALAAAGDHHGSTYYQHLKFANSVLYAEPVEVTALDGIKAVRMGVAAQESICTGQAVQLAVYPAH